MMTLSELFDPAPASWGLRGDPHLWAELREALRGASLPASEQALAALIAQTFERLTGAPLAGREPIYVARLNHGGMSGGYVDPRFWADQAIPLLCARFRAAADAGQPQ